MILDIAILSVMVLTIFFSMRKGFAMSVVGHIFSHHGNEGFVGIMDWLLGLLLGAILGIVYVFVFLALLLPVVGLFMPENCETVLGWLDNSLIAGDLYDNNILLILFRDFLNFAV